MGPIITNNDLLFLDSFKKQRLKEVNFNVKEVYNSMLLSLTESRLEKYKKIAEKHSFSEREVVLLYEFNSKFSKEAFIVINYFEIAFRNFCDDMISKKCNAIDGKWYLKKFKPNDEYLHNALKIAKYGRKDLESCTIETLNKNKMISSLTFGFWVNLFNPATNLHKFWEPYFEDFFKRENITKYLKKKFNIDDNFINEILLNKYKKDLTCKGLYDRLLKINIVRNEIAHHKCLICDGFKALYTICDIVPFILGLINPILSIRLSEIRFQSADPRLIWPNEKFETLEDSQNKFK